MDSLIYKVDGFVFGLGFVGAYCKLLSDGLWWIPRLFVCFVNAVMFRHSACLPLVLNGCHKQLIYMCCSHQIHVYTYKLCFNVLMIVTQTNICFDYLM